jgi:hypothetical protein
MQLPILSTRFGWLLLVLLLPACSGLRKAADSSAAAGLPPRQEDVLLQRLLDNQVRADWMDARARITYADEYGGESFSSVIRIRKDSAIWMVFKKFSIEGARVLITPDSAHILDRLNGAYTALPFSELISKYELPLSFDGLQALLLGNPVFFSRESEALNDTGSYVLRQKTDAIQADYRLDADTYRLREFQVEDFRNRRSVSMTTDQYLPLADQRNFSYFRRLKLSTPDLGQVRVDIEFTKVELDVPQNMDFKVPPQYSRAR